MKKVILALVVLVLLVVGLAPLGFGYWGEQRFNALLDQLSDAGVADYTVTKFDRGWFNSTSEVVLELGGDVGDAYREYQRKAQVKDIQPLTVTLRNTIHQGPLAFGAMSQGGSGLVPAVAVIDTQVVAVGGKPLPKGPVPVGIRTRLSLMGGGVTTMDVPAYKGPVGKSGGTVDWKGMKGSIAFDAGFRKAVLRMSAPHLDVQDKDASVSMAGFKLDADLHKLIDDVPVGKAHFVLDSLDVSLANKAEQHFTLTGLDLDESASKGKMDGTVDSTATLRAKSIRIGSLELGPALMDASMINLDAKAYGSIRRTAKDLSRQHLPDQQRGMMLGAAVLGVLPQLLERGPVFEIKELSVDSKFGKVLGRLRLTVDTSNKGALSNPLLLKDAIIASAHVELPRRFAVAMSEINLRKQAAALDLQYPDEQIHSMAEARVDNAMQNPKLSRLFVLKDGVYRLDASMKGGKLTVNGQPFVPPAAAPAPQQ